MLQPHLQVLSTGIAMAPGFTVTALLFTATAAALRITAMALDITAIGVAALTTRIACQSVPVRGGEQWIEQIAGAMSAAAAAFNWATTHTASRPGVKNGQRYSVGCRTEAAMDRPRHVRSVPLTDIVADHSDGVHADGRWSSRQRARNRAAG